MEPNDKKIMDKLVALAQEDGSVHLASNKRGWYEVGVTPGSNTVVVLYPDYTWELEPSFDD